MRMLKLTVKCDQCLPAVSWGHKICIYFGLYQVLLKEFFRKNILKLAVQSILYYAKDTHLYVQSITSNTLHHSNNVLYTRFKKLQCFTTKQHSWGHLFHSSLHRVILCLSSFLPANVRISPFPLLTAFIKTDGFSSWCSCSWSGQRQNVQPQKEFAAR